MLRNRSRDEAKRTEHAQLPKGGVEPPRGCPQQILSLSRLPFRHFGILGYNYRVWLASCQQDGATGRGIAIG